jgi:hypothetical protein
MDDPDVAKLIDESVTDAMPEEGAIRITTTVLGCPVCEYRIINHEPELFADHEWIRIQRAAVSIELHVNNRASSNCFAAEASIHRHPLDSEEKECGAKNARSLKSEGVDALVEAVISNDLNLVKSLVSEGANPKAKNKMGYAALDYARGHGFSDIETYLTSVQKD